MATVEASLSSVVPQVLGRKDYAIIGEMVEEGASVLDLGCGEGELLEWLVERRGVKARGVEISPEKVRQCVARGLSRSTPNRSTDRSGPECASPPCGRARPIFRWRKPRGGH